MPFVPISILLHVSSADVGAITFGTKEVICDLSRVGQLVLLSSADCGLSADSHHVYNT